MSEDRARFANRGKRDEPSAQRGENERRGFPVRVVIAVGGQQVGKRLTPFSSSLSLA